MGRSRLTGTSAGCIELRRPSSVGPTSTRRHPMTTCACGNCQFFDTRSKAAMKHKEKDSGLCRYYPPLPQSAAGGHGGTAHGVWPVVQKEEWCGHFAATVERFMSTAA